MDVSFETVGWVEVHLKQNTQSHTHARTHVCHIILSCIEWYSYFCCVVRDTEEMVASVQGQSEASSLWWPLGSLNSAGHTHTHIQSERRFMCNSFSVWKGLLINVFVCVCVSVRVNIIVYIHWLCNIYISIFTFYFHLTKFCACTLYMGFVVLLWCCEMEKILDKILESVLIKFSSFA